MEKSIEQFLKDNNISYVTIKLIKEGISNANYLIDNKYVLKVPYDRRFSRVRKETVDLENICFKNFLSPEVVAYDEENGFLLTKYIPNLRILNAQNTNYFEIKNIVEAIKKYHRIKADIPKLDYEKLLDSYRLKINPKERIYNSKLTYSKIFAGEYELSHFDLVDNNILLDSNSNVTLIDFEFACYAPKYFDLVSLLGENRFSKEIEEMIIDIYFDNKEEKNEFLAKKDELLAIADLLWYHWAKARSLSPFADKKKIYLSIAKDKKESLEQYLKTNK